MHAGARADRELDTQGYSVAEAVIGAAALDELRAGFEARVACGAAPSETGTRHIADLGSAGGPFARVLALPQIQASAERVLGTRGRLQHYSGRDPLPGFGAQGLHTDAIPRAPRSPYVAATALVLLDDFTLENGATRVVPGTHVIPGQVPKSFARPGARHPEEIVIVAPAGSLVFFNGHLWHSGTQNRSSTSRRVLQIQLVV